MAKNLICENARNKYEYIRYNMYEIKSSGFFSRLFKGNDTTTVGHGKYSKTYYNLYCGFDIETYTTDTFNAFMYIWQFSIWDGIDRKIVIHGRTWTEFNRLLDYLENGLLLDNKHRLLVFIANCSYEWGFIRKRINCTDGFFKSDRQPLKFTHNDCIEFQECLSVSGGSLKYLANNYTNTQKCDGKEFNYNEPRNSKTKLNDIQLYYCDNDVLILAEWSKYYFGHYMMGGCGYKSQPLTIQSTIRHDIKELAKEWYENQGFNGSHVTRAIASCYPQEKTYDYLMKWCFRGGYCHGNIAHIGHLFNWLDGIASYDFTSSYPAIMLQCYMPSRFYRMKEVTYKEYQELIKNKCVIATMKFKNLKAKTQHSIESKSKCISLKGELIDNGRVMECDEIVVCLTELDYRTYTRFYEFDNEVEIIDCLVSNRIMLPDYVIKPLIDSYTKKAELKKQGLNYAVEKSRTNSFYGVMVTRMSLENYYIDETSDCGLSYKKGSSYEEQINKSVLLPQWGIYITAWGRYRILELAYQCGNDTLYIDTDSIKVLHADRYNHIFKQYNTRIEKMNKKICDKYNLDFDIFKDLGCLDLEYPKLINLKFLGAKRYLYSYLKNGKITTNQTIAGLPKNTLNNMFSDRKTMYEFFKNEMDVVESGKLYTYYNDNVVTEIISDLQGNSVEQTELSNVGLAPCEFNMSLDKHWLEYFLSYQETIKGKEKR